ncbi:MAG: anti-sigma factor [Actinomycetota bacterium]|nr:anti-sigma factor [Actinomycetota bacterium]
MSSCREFEVLLAAHAFAALEPDEDEAVETHLAGCTHCRRAYSQLTQLPSLLDLAGSTEARFASPPPLLEASVLAALPAGGERRSRRRPRFARRRSRQATATGWRGVRVRSFALALTVGLALVVIGVTQLPASSPRSVRLTLAPSPLAPASRAVAILRSRPWGTEVDLQAQHLAPTRGTQIYEMWFVSPRGRVSAGTFTVGTQGHVTVTLASAAHAGQYRTLGVTLEPDGLNPARRGPNILRANLHA